MLRSGRRGERRAGVRAAMGRRGSGAYIQGLDCEEGRRLGLLMRDPAQDSKRRESRGAGEWWSNLRFVPFALWQV